MNAAADHTFWAQLLVSALARAGVAHVVISPGSRSTPLAWAALRNQDLVTHAILDERCAAFFALGIARSLHAPAALVCTSGTAVGHYLPAVMEASQSGLPLVVLSADRPPELQHATAPQTIDQVGVFGAFVRHGATLGLPDSSSVTLRALARTVLQTVARACAPIPGPVHLNVPLPKPLEPPLDLNSDSELKSRAASILSALGPAPVARSIPEQDPISRIAEDIRSSTSGFIAPGASVCPDELEPSALFALAEVTGFPVLCETASGARLALQSSARPYVCDAVDHVLEAALPPDGKHTVLQLGGPLVSAAYPRWLDRTAPLRLHIVCSRGWPDPGGHAASVLCADVSESVRMLTKKLQTAEGARAAPRASFLASIHRHCAHWWAAVEQTLSATPSTSALREADLIRALVHRLPPGAALVLGNSLPVREVDWFAPAQSSGVRVFSQRGVNGIDGAISGAAGIAATCGGPVLALLGDLTFLHDVGGLAAASTIDKPLVLVVLNNRGGRIFDHLPLGALSVRRDLLERGWTLPHTSDFGALASGYGLPFARLQCLDELPSALRTFLGHAGASVLEVPVDPSSAQAALNAARRAAGALERIGDG